MSRVIELREKITDWKSGKLPKEKGEYLLTIEGYGYKRLDIGKLISIDNKHWNWEIAEKTTYEQKRSGDEKVIAWIKLPEPYEEVKE